MAAAVEYTFRFRNGTTRAQVNVQAGTELEYCIGAGHVLAKCCPGEFSRVGNDVFIGAGHVQRMCVAGIDYDAALLQEAPCAFVASTGFLSEVFKSLVNGGHLTAVVPMTRKEFLVVFSAACTAAGGFVMLPADVHKLDIMQGTGHGLGQNDLALAVPVAVKLLETATLQSLRVDGRRPIGYGELVVVINGMWRTAERRKPGGVCEVSCQFLLDAAETKFANISSRSAKAQASACAQFLVATRPDPPLVVLPAIVDIDSELCRRMLPSDEAFYDALRDDGWRCYRNLSAFLGAVSYEVAHSCFRDLLFHMSPSVSLRLGLAALSTRVGQLSPSVPAIGMATIEVRVERMGSLLAAKKAGEDKVDGAGSVLATADVLERAARLPLFRALLDALVAASGNPMDYKALAGIGCAHDCPAARTLFFAKPQPRAMIANARWSPFAAVKSSSVQQCFDDVLCDVSSDATNTRNLGTLSEVNAVRIPSGRIANGTTAGIAWWSGIVVPYLDKANPGCIVEGRSVPDAKIWMNRSILDEFEPIVTRLLKAAAFPTKGTNSFSALMASTRAEATAISRLPLGPDRDGLAVQLNNCANMAFELAGRARIEVLDTAVDVAVELPVFVQPAVQQAFANLQNDRAMFESETRRRSLGIFMSLRVLRDLAALGARASRSYVRAGTRVALE